MKKTYKAYILDDLKKVISVILLNDTSPKKAIEKHFKCKVVKIPKDTLRFTSVTMNLFHSNINVALCLANSKNFVINYYNKVK